MLHPKPSFHFSDYKSVSRSKPIVPAPSRAVPSLAIPPVQLVQIFLQKDCSCLDQMKQMTGKTFDSRSEEG